MQSDMVPVAVIVASLDCRRFTVQTGNRSPLLCTRCGGPAFDGLSRYGPCTAIEDASRSPKPTMNQGENAPSYSEEARMT